MSQLTSRRTGFDQHRHSATPAAEAQREAESENEALSRDTSNVDATSAKLSALASYLDAAQKSHSYVSEWLYHRNDSDNRRNSRNDSPKTVVGIDASPGDSVGDDEYATGSQLNGSLAGAYSPSVEKVPTELECSNLSRYERSFRPRSHSRSREEIASPRSQRPRSPSPVRRQSITASMEAEILDTKSGQSQMHPQEEDICQARERPLRPRSPSPVRVASPPDLASRSRPVDDQCEKIEPVQHNAEYDYGGAPEADRGRSQQEAESLQSLEKLRVGSMAERVPLAGQTQVSSQTVLQAQADTPSQSRSLLPESTLPDLHRGATTETLDTVDHGGAVRDPTPAEEVNSDSTTVPSPLRRLVQRPPPFVPMPPPPDALLPPPPMMPAVFNIARSLAGARLGRRFSEPLKPGTLRSRATQADVENGPIQPRLSYEDSSTQTTPVKQDWGPDPRSSGFSRHSMASNASRGTQTTEHSSQPLSTSSSDLLFPLRQQDTSSSFATQNEPEAQSSSSSRRLSLLIAKSEPSPKRPPPNAKSTRISRILVNPEALSFMRVPHEAHDAYIAVHRILSREEIIKLAELTIDIREARSSGHETQERMWEQWRSERYKT